MSAAVSYERVRDELATLGLEAGLTSLDPVLARGHQDRKVVVEVLDELLGLELAARFERRIATNRKLSGPPTLKTLESFDFAAHPRCQSRQSMNWRRSASCIRVKTSRSSVALRIPFAPVR